MDGVDMPLGAMPDGPRDASRWQHEQLHAVSSRGATSALRPSVASAISEPATPQEIDAILAVVPRGCRGNAAWAVPLLVDTARSGGITHPRRIAYVLATAHHASRFGAQLVETGPGPGTDCANTFFARFEPGTPGGALRGNTEPGDGERFRGRGFVYVKGRAAYATWSRRLGMPEHIVDGRALPFFVAHPEAMARAHVAAQTLVRGMRDGLFTGIALGYYVNDKKTDYYNARRVINATVDARDVAELAMMYAGAIEAAAAERHRAHMQHLATRRAAADVNRDFLQEVRDAVDRLAQRGEILAFPVQVVDWNGEARQGKFVQLDERTCALHMGRGIYVRLDIQRDLNGIVPAEGKNMALKRSGDVRPAMRGGDGDFWR